MATTLLNFFLVSKNNSSSKRWRRVSEMTKHQPDFYNKKSKRYVSELCIIAVFYLIPVGQLVWNYKDVKIDVFYFFKNNDVLKGRKALLI